MDSIYNVIECVINLNYLRLSESCTLGQSKGALLFKLDHLSPQTLFTNTPKKECDVRQKNISKIKLGIMLGFAGGMSYPQLRIDK